MDELRQAACRIGTPPARARRCSCTGIARHRATGACARVAAFEAASRWTKGALPKCGRLAAHDLALVRAEAGEVREQRGLGIAGAHLDAHLRACVRQGRTSARCPACAASRSFRHVAIDRRVGRPGRCAAHARCRRTPGTALSRSRAHQRLCSDYRARRGNGRSR